MKRVLVAGLLVAGIAGVSFAGEHEGNPDRRPSIGVNYTGHFLSGDAEVTSGGLSAKQDADVVSGALTLDTRIPVSNNVTFNAAVGFIGTASEVKETNILNGGEDSLGGVLVNVGVRFYL